MSSVVAIPIDREEYLQYSATWALPLYAAPYWLEAAGGAQAIRYFAILYGKEAVALAPCYFPIKGFWSIPPACQHGGIYFAPRFENKELSSGDFQLRRRAIEALLETISSTLHYAYIPLYRDCLDALPFHWRGFRLRVRYNYRLRLPKTREDYLKEVNRLVRRKVKAREDAGDLVKFGLPLEDLLPFFSRFYAERGISRVYYKALVRCSREAIARGYGLTAGLYSSENRLLSAYFIGFSGRCGYSIATATLGRHPYANTALLFEILCELIHRGFHTFDFEGSMLEGVEPVFRSLGGKQELFIEAEKGRQSLLDKILLKIHYNLKIPNRIE